MIGAVYQLFFPGLEANSASEVRIRPRSRVLVQKTLQIPIKLQWPVKRYIPQLSGSKSTSGRRSHLGKEPQPNSALRCSSLAGLHITQKAGSSLRLSKRIVLA